jgi:hypothetical protein
LNALVPLFVVELGQFHCRAEWEGEGEMGRGGTSLEFASDENPNYEEGAEERKDLKSQEAKAVVQCVLCISFILSLKKDFMIPVCRYSTFPLKTVMAFFGSFFESSPRFLLRRASGSNDF